MNGKKSSEVLSDDMSEFISQQPTWIMKKGNLLILIMFICLVFLSWTIEYPDIIKAPMKILANEVPKLVIAKKEGKLIKLFVKNGDDVVSGQILAVLQSTANYQQILDLYKWTEVAEPTLHNDRFESSITKSLPISNDLGEMQSEFETFEGILRETFELNVGYYKNLERVLRDDLTLLTDVQTNLSELRKNTIKDLELQMIEYNAKESLASEKVVPLLELNADQSKVLSKKQMIGQFNTDMFNAKLSRQNKIKEILTLKKEISEQRQTFRGAFYNLKSSLKQWINQYIILASAKGKVHFVNFLQENQNLQLNQELLYIIPQTNIFYGELQPGQQGLGKIQLGQKVIVRINSFPSDEYGYLNGKIEYIPTMLADDNAMQLRVSFDQGLRTNYGKEILFKNNMTGTAEIITDDRRIGDRILGKLREIARR